AETYQGVTDNPFICPDAPERARSTFSIDVDTASYANTRRFLTQGALPPAAAVRVEEMVNYFTYDYPNPTGDDPFSVNVEVGQCPWSPAHRLARVGLKGREIARDQRPVCNLVFLIDVSGSMLDANKLPLVKAGLSRMARELGENDRVAVVVYAGASGLALPSTSGLAQREIQAAIDRLNAGGSTNGGAGIRLAYRVAREHFVKGGANRVILCTDGDFNVGVTNRADLVRLVEEQAKSGVFLTVLGFGMGNLKDATLEQLADKGNGNYAYIDTLKEAEKVLVTQMSGTLVTIAKDVKVQIEFNPAAVAAYRLIGYENRVLAARDFNDDRKDAGEIGAGHTVTALYEIVPAGAKPALAGGDALKYQAAPALTDEARSGGDLFTLSLRYKAPDGDTSKLITHAVRDGGAGGIAATSRDYRFAAAVALFGMTLRGSPHRAGAGLDLVVELAQEAVGKDQDGFRAEFVDLARRAKALGGR
ncbi:MAG: VWA domain-containing protein, partial [Planctomycetes bacterium]|nr:VWA domain-containing protein [Planctomycetota bacterium]